MKILFIWFLLILLLSAALSASAQTNAVPVPAADTAIVVHNAGEAFTALLHYSGFSATDAALLLLLAKAILGYVRNFALKNKSADETGVVGRFIAHAAGASLPDAQPLTTQDLVPELPKPAVNVGINLSK
jgi:hypothetical protein